MKIIDYFPMAITEKCHVVEFHGMCADENTSDIRIMCNVLEDIVDHFYPLCDVKSLISKHPYLICNQLDFALGKGVIEETEYIAKIDDLLALFLCYLILVWDADETTLKKYHYTSVKDRIKNRMSQSISENEVNFDINDIDYDDEMEYLEECKTLLEDDTPRGFCTYALWFHPASEYTVRQNCKIEKRNGKYVPTIYEVCLAEDRFSQFAIILKRLIKNGSASTVGCSLAKCKSCGKEFVRNHGNVKFCSFCGSGSQRTRECRERKKASKSKEVANNGKP